MTLDRYCEVCGEVLTAVRPHARYCSPKCRQTASRAARSRPTRNPDDMSPMPFSEVASSQVSGSGSVTAPAGMFLPSERVTAAPGPAGQVADAHHWPAVAVANLRAAGLDEDAATFQRYFRERGEWR